LFRSDILVDTVPLRTGLTLAVRVGAAPEWFLAALAALGVVAVVVHDRRSRPLPGGSAPQPAGNGAEQEMVEA
jgi:apolipoprotein N-acyltransferase